LRDRLDVELLIGALEFVALTRDAPALAHAVGKTGADVPQPILQGPGPHAPDGPIEAVLSGDRLPHEPSPRLRHLVRVDAVDWCATREGEGNARRPGRGADPGRGEQRQTPEDRSRRPGAG